MKIAFFSIKPYDIPFFDDLNRQFGHELHYHETQLHENTAILAGGTEVACLFVSDDGKRPVLEKLKEQGVKLIALRSAGYNHIDLDAAKELGMKVVRVPAYSPYAVAEHTLALILTLNRKTHRAYNRVKEGNFSLNGLLGFDLHGTTAGLIGLGKIGKVTAKILKGFGCRVLGYDVEQDEEWQQLGVEYVELEELLAQSDIVSLHCPLTPQTHHLINCDTIYKMKKGVMLINTSRGAIIDTRAVLDALKKEHIGYLGLDVYEEEADLFFEDLSDKVIQDDVFMRLLTFPNVLITGHQAFFTRNALHNIAETTLQNVSDFEQGKELVNRVNK
ncbi:MAG: 2-hydroxyacid dehydrogenase [Hymenobacteraceae bacterium]|nr:2-hydroxyacid dehydrogenase [Hymenobacteraceae bacterium]MDX5395504.1 2-hydroxyacid dehydrogenase [Hymenobacteraceae bacterium]MDX5511559.1 2-hydroxyacid dehydrogenase [Hymenobacteraceae bacterium]